MILEDDGCFLIIDARGLDESEYPCKNEGNAYRIGSSWVTIICPECLAKMRKCPNGKAWVKTTEEEFFRARDEDLVRMIMVI